MQIAMIGAGNVGSSLGRSAVKAGHTVRISAAHPSKAETVAAEIGAVAAASNVDAVQGAELVILAIPLAAAFDVAAELAGSLAGKVVVDCINPLNATYSDLDIKGSCCAEDLQYALGGVPVVKAFNSILASRHANPSEDGTPLDGFYAGDDDAAKAKVADLIASVGFRPIDAGGLRMARALEEMAFLNISLNARNGWPWQSAWRLVGPTGQA
jgi:predicted dinucleotide-binding enzyme